MAIEINLLMTPALLKELSQAHSNIDDKLITPEIVANQDMYIMPLLGSTLFNKLVTDIKNSTLAGDYQTLLEQYVIKCLLNYVLASLPGSVNQQIWNTGTATKRADNSEPQSMSDMYDHLSKYKSRAEFYKERTRLYLLQQTSLQKFPEYITYITGIDTVPPDKESYSLPFVTDTRRWHDVPTNIDYFKNDKKS